MQEVIERMSVMVGDITRLEVEALVNAANESLLGGGGVDGAIHRAAGPRLRAHNQTLGGCATGAAVRTPAFELEARGVRHLIHTVGPVWGSDRGATGREPLGERREDIQLAQAYLACLELARQHQVATLAFPSISTGVYGFPKARAAKIAVGHVRGFLSRTPLPGRVIFCCFSAEDAALYQAELAGIDHTRSILDEDDPE